MSRRGPDDIQWKACRSAVFERDGHKCRMLRIISVSEAIALKRAAGVLMNKNDPAHFLAVSERPDLYCDVNNVCTLNRFSHSCLDSNKDPITGSPISSENVFAWWLRILKGDKLQFRYLLNKGIIGDEYGR